MQDAFVLSERVKKLPDAAGEPLNEHDFDAQFVAEVNVSGRENQVVIIVLGVGQFLAESGQVMIVDERQGADRLVVFLPFDLHQSLADHVADELGSVGVPAFALEFVEFVQERFFK